MKLKLETTNLIVVALLLIPETPRVEVRLLVFDPLSFLYPGISLVDSAGKGI